VTYKAGWNLVSAPQGTTITGNTGSMYTYQAGDTNYETVNAGTPVKPGYGYWAYFQSQSTGTIPLTTGGSVTVTLPAGSPVMIGNPGSTTAQLSGADSVVTYDPVAGTYSQVTSLAPGQGGWAMSYNGGSVTITNASS
jgi:hypothetical protein